MSADADDLPTIHSLDELALLVEHDDDLFLRWSRGPAVDRLEQSRDDLTGRPMSGLSANPLAVEEWWQGGSVRTWVARRIYDYRHLRDVRGPGVRPWVLRGEERGRGPDNEPLVTCDDAIAWIDDTVVDEAVNIVERERADWGPLRRS